jgi:hypothetical protein
MGDDTWPNLKNPYIKNWVQGRINRRNFINATFIRTRYNTWNNLWK